MRSGIPSSVIEEDHRLEGSQERATEKLAKHRWHQTLDPAGPGHSVLAYAKAIGRSQATVRRHAKGYELFVNRLAVNAISLEDAFRLADQAVEQQEFSNAIAEGLGEPVGRVARGDNSRRRDIVGRAKERAARRGTDPVDEARDIATRERQTREMRARHQAQAKERRTLRYVEIEGDLANAQRRLIHALGVAEGVGFGDEEMELIRDSIAKIRAVLDLIDLRMAGAPDIDWDAEMMKLSES